MIIPYQEIQTDYKNINYLGYTIIEAYCFNPLCDCDKAHLLFCKDTGEEFKEIFAFTLLLSKKKFDDLEIIDDINNPEEIITSLIDQEEIINQFKRNYINTKLCGLTNDIPEVTMPSIDEFDEGDMHGFCELFPEQDFITISLNDNKYYIYDTYCVDPHCDCNHVEIHFIKIDEEKSQYQIALSIDYYFEDDDYDIKQKKCSIKQAKQIVEYLVLSTDLLDEFKLRYNSIKEVSEDLFNDFDYDDEDDDDINLFNFDDDDDDFDFFEDELDDYYDVRNEKLYQKIYKSSDFQTLISQLDLSTLKNIYSLLTDEETKLKKQELINWFTKNYISYVHDLLSNLHNEILDFIFEVVDLDGEIEAKYIKYSNAAFMKFTLLAFPVKMDNESTLVMSDEVLDILKSLDRKKMYYEVKENDTIIKYLRILLNIYGECDSKILFNYLNEYENIQYSYDDKIYLLNYDSVFTESYDIQYGIIYNLFLNEVLNYEENREKNKHLHYYKIPHSVFIDEDLYLDELDDLILFLENQFDEDDETIDEFIESVFGLIKIEIDLDNILDLFKPFPFPKNLQKQFISIMSNLYNNTRLFSLKGHTRNEVMKDSKFIPFKLNKK